MGAATGLLILNADDWGRDRENTQKILDCSVRGSLSSASAMVFMEDSERAAAIARERGFDTGLHLNFTTLFTSRNCPWRLLERQRELSSRLRRHRFSSLLYYPGLKASFEYVLSAQIDEYHRLYGAPPVRIDGHHHMHLCTNILAAGLLPRGITVRRSFSFSRSEKSWANRMYRQAIDCVLTRHYRSTDFFFSIAPLEPQRLKRISSLARQYVVEVETHPVNPEEHRFLSEGAVFRWAGTVPIEPGYALRP